jgi:hypothetical protein
MYEISIVFHYLCEKNYYGAVEDAKNIKLVDSIKSRNVFMIFVGLGLEVSVMAKAVFNRQICFQKTDIKISPF